MRLPFKHYPNLYTQNKTESIGSENIPRIKLNALRMPRGWVIVTLRLNLYNTSTCLPKLHLEVEGGYDKKYSNVLPISQLGECKRLVYIPWKSRQLCLYPIETKDRFAIKELCFKLVPPWRVYKLITKQLSSHPRYYQHSAKQLLKSLKQNSKESGIAWKKLALKHYEELFTADYKASSYTYWIEHIEKPNLQEVVIKKRLKSLLDRPLISIILPTYNTAPQYLRACIDSVLKQSYTNWELCIADDASSQPELLGLLEDYANKYSQIKLVLRSENGHISAASNSALAQATGEFVALLDHDDLLAPNALLCVVEKILEDPNIRVLYSDEDQIDKDGKRHSPYFKPDWNPELLRSQNYFCHLSVYDRNLINKLGGLKTGLEGAQDWDLALRATEQLDSSQIGHITEILYHWREVPGSTAISTKEKKYILAASQRTLEEHVKRTGLCARVLPTKGNHWRIEHQLPKKPPLVSLLIPTHNGIEILKPCIETILQKTSYPNYEIIIIDNNSDDSQTFQFLRDIARIPKVKVIYDSGPFNYSAINNRAVTKAKGSILAFLNNDIEPINSDWLSEMVSEALQPQTGAVGAMLYYPNDRVQHAGIVLGIAGPRLVNDVAGHAFKNFPRGHGGRMNRMRLRQNYSAVTAACLVVRREVFEIVGGFNEADLTVSFNDVDLCLRIRAAGFRNLWTPFAELYHHESASRGRENTMAKKERARKEIEYMRKTWSDLLDNDPAYNPHLTLINEDFSIGR